MVSLTRVSPALRSETSLWRAVFSSSRDASSRETVELIRRSIVLVSISSELFDSVLGGVPLSMIATGAKGEGVGDSG